jgi:hypothetical protein
MQMPADADASRCGYQQMQIPADFWQMPADADTSRFLADASRFTGGR